jgi:hypothetical protein
MLPNCAPAAISTGLPVKPPATESPSQRVHSTEAAAVFPKQKLKIIPIPREEALTGSVISLAFTAFLLNSKVGPTTGRNSRAYSFRYYKINNFRHYILPLPKYKAINQPRIVKIFASLILIGSILLSNKPITKAIMQPM